MGLNGTLRIRGGGLQLSCNASVFQTAHAGRVSPVGRAKDARNVLETVNGPIPLTGHFLPMKKLKPYLIIAAVVLVVLFAVNRVPKAKALILG